MNAIVPHTEIITSPTDRHLLDAVNLGFSMWSEVDTYSFLQPDMDKMIEFAYLTRQHEDTFCGVAVRDNVVTGYLVGSLAPYGFADAQFSYDRMLFVAKKHRGGRTAKMLIDAFEEWSRIKGAVVVKIGVTSGIHTDMTEKFYNKMGYHTVGKLTMKELN